MNLKEWAAANGVGYSTARQWFLDGKLPVPARRVGGLILVDGPGPPATREAAVVYARVSSADQRTDLDRQVARIVTWAGEQGITVDRVVTEVGSALNGRRRKFLALLRDPQVSTILWNTGTGSPDSAPNTWKPRSPLPDVGSSWSTRPRSTTTWSGT